MAVPVKLFFRKANDQIVTLSGLKDSLTDAFQNAALVTATLQDHLNAPVAGLSGLTLGYVAASNGDYRGQVEEVFDPAEGGGYKLVIDAVEGSLVGHWEVPVEVKTRVQ